MFQCVGISASAQFRSVVAVAVAHGAVHAVAVHADVAVDAVVIAIGVHHVHIHVHVAASVAFFDNRKAIVVIHIDGVPQRSATERSGVCTVPYVLYCTITCLQWLQWFVGPAGVRCGAV